MVKILSRILKEISSSPRFKTKFVRHLTSNHLYPSEIDFHEKFALGNKISGFQVDELKNVPELQLLAIKMHHLKSGANYLHIARQDSNNVFCIGFKTTPMNSTGVPHILEHNVLCGSQRFPCRDPFFKMLSRSLATFMNAMTGSDYTIYPFCTQNEIDYRNLMSVYLDAVFKPNLNKIDFLQEGWRLENEDLSDKASPITFKGVVYNEMKGAFADSHCLFMQKLQNGILPSHTYGYISGGDPSQIPSLTWEELKEFHSHCYHPSNCRIFSYGDFPLESHLDYIDAEYLSKYEKVVPNTAVPDEPRWEKPRNAHISCSVDSMIPVEKQTSLAITYLLNNIDEIFENFVLAILGVLLIDGPNAPFYKTLIESGLGTSFTPIAGYDGSTRNTTFTIGVQGIHNSNVNEVSCAIERTFDNIVKEGFSAERIESVIHNIELATKHQTTNFGLDLIMNLTPLWNHGGDILGALDINYKINKFRKTIKENPNFLQEKVENYFRKNKHKFTLSMSPEENFDQSLVIAEQNLLQKKIEKLTTEDKEEIWNLGNILKSKQEIKEDTSSLPTLFVSDIVKTLPNINIIQENVCGDIPLQLCVQPTNGIIYFNTILNTKGLSPDLLGLVPLFCSILPNMGAGQMDFRDFSQKTDILSGGFSSQFHLTNHPINSSLYEQGILLSSHCLEKNFASMLHLWSILLNELRLDDTSRFMSLVKMTATEKANTLVYQGHHYAMTFASSSTNYVSHIRERLDGISYLQYLKHLSDDEILSEVLTKMQYLANHLLNKNQIRLSLCLSEQNLNEVPRVEKFLETLNGTPKTDTIFARAPSTYTPSKQQTHHVLPFPVNYSSKARVSVPYSHPDSGPLRVLARLMFHFLHREIREKRGAYGGGAMVEPGEAFCFYSYRDPYSIETLQTFDDAVDWVLSQDFTQQDVDEAKLGVFQKIDTPVSPGMKGLRYFLQHIPDAMLDSHRRSILETQSDNIVAVCQKYLGKHNSFGTCLIGPPTQSIGHDSAWNVVSY